MEGRRKVGLKLLWTRIIHSLARAAAAFCGCGGEKNARYMLLAA